MGQQQQPVPASDEDYSEEYEDERGNSVGGLFRVSSTGVRGPLYAESSAMYAFFAAVLLAAQYSGWAPCISSHSLIPYGALAAAALELPRLLRRSWELPARLYATLAPFVVLCVASRETHDSVSAVYLSMVLSIYLQGGVGHRDVHAMVYAGAFVVCYFLSVLAMLLLFRDPGTAGASADTTGRALNPALHWGKECTVLVAMAVLGVGFTLMQKFIRVYAGTLVARHGVYEKLKLQNKDLSQRYHQIQKETRAMLDVESPIVAAIKSMNSLVDDRRSVPAPVRDKLRCLLVLLSQLNKVYAPDLSGADKDVGAFLHNMLIDGAGGGSSTGVPSTSGSTTSLAQQAPQQGRIARAPTHFRQQQRARTGGTSLSTTSKDSSVVTTSSTKRLSVTFPVPKPEVPTLTSEGERVLSTIFEKLESWEGFDVFEVDRITNGHALYWIGTALFTRYNVSRKFGISDATLRRFCRVLEDGYSRDNPYHNAVHAADVAQTVNYFLVTGNVAKYLSDLDMFAAIVAALAHDFQHPGLNNAYHTNTMDPLAVVYNDRSVLENFHCSQLFAMLSSTVECNLLAGLTDQQYRDFRESVVNMILATDLAQHFDLLGKFKAKQSTGGFARPDRSARLLMLAIAIKVADVCNPCRNPVLCVKWASVVMEEFFKQGDQERRAGMTVSPFMDRSKPAIATCQVGFNDFIVLPLLEAWCSFVPERAATEVVMRNLRINMETWHASQK